MVLTQPSMKGPSMPLLCPGAELAPSWRHLRVASKYVQMDQALVHAKFGSAAAQGKGRTHDVGHSL